MNPSDRGPVMAPMNPARRDAARTELLEQIHSSTGARTDDQPLAAVPTPLQWREKARRRSTRVLTGAAVAVAAAAFAVVLPVIDVNDNKSTGPAVAQFLGVLPAAAADAGCTNANLPLPGPADPDREVPQSSWSQLPEVTRILYTLPEQATADGRVMSSPAICDALPVVVLYDDAGDRGINVYRDVTEVFRGINGLTSTTVQGRPAQVLTPPAGCHYITWVDASGVRWFAEANGMTVDELTSTLDTSLDGHGLISVPAGYLSAPVMTVDPESTVYRWSAQYGGTFLEVTTPPRFPVQTRSAWPFETQYTTFDGRDASYLPVGQGGAELRWNTDTANFRLIVPGADLAELQRIAAGLELLPLDDDRTGRDGH